MLTMRRSLCAACVLLAFACRAKSREAPRADAPREGGVEATPTAAAATPEASAPAPPPGCPRYAPAMARGRERTKAADYDAALEAFDEARRAKPFSAEMWAERGYAELLAGKDALPSLAVARSLTKKPALLGAIWFNEGLMLARAGKPDEARLRFAVARDLGNTAADAKLAGASRCTATWTTEPDPIPFVKGWVGVLDRMPGATCTEERAKKTTEAAARKEACRGCDGLQDPLTGDHCIDGIGVMIIPNGHMHCHTFSVKVQAFGGGRFTVDEDEFQATPEGYARTIVAGAPMDEARFTEVSAQIMADKVDGGCPVDVSAETELDFPEHCMMGEAWAPIRGPEVMQFWDRAGKGRLAVTAWSAKPTVTFQGKTARIEGAGCSETVQLAR
jgi:hypothetical protein